MHKNKKILAVIPARGVSKGIPRKNIRILAGKPLIAYSIEASLKSKYIDRTIVSTEDREIAEISKKYGAEVIDRPKELARDDSPVLLAVRHAIEFLEKEEGYKVDVIVLLQPTSPLREVFDIDSAVEKILETGADLVLSVTEMKYHPAFSFEMDGDKLIPFVKDTSKITRRQDLEKIYTINGALYVMTKGTLKKDNIYTGDIRAVIMSPERSIDIDTMSEFKIAEFLVKELKRKDN